MPLDEHRLLGAAGTAALLAPDATVDWWCTPSPHDAPVLWRVLDESGGASSWLGATPAGSSGLAAGPCARSRVLIEGCGVACWDGLVRIDGEPTLVRLVRAVTEPVRVTHALVAAVFDPGEELGDHLLRVHHDDHAQSRTGGLGVVHTTLTAVADEWRGVVLRQGGSPEPPVDAGTLTARLLAAETRASARLHGSGVVSFHRDRVQTGLLVLDACTEPSTGAVIASPTTSIPEVPGADRQFDYRFAWVRDASLAAAVASLLGQTTATRAHLSWLLERCFACEGVPVPVTDVFGAPVPDERELPQVAGHGGARPVRVGNAAKDQLQVDGAGFVAEAIWMLTTHAGLLHRGAFTTVAALADHVASLPREPSGGIWEQREPADVSSAEVGRWLLFDRALRLQRLYAPWNRRRRRRWASARDDARARVLGSLLPSGAVPLVLGGSEADSTGLLIVLLGLLGRDDPTAHRIVDGTIAELGVGEPTVALRRYSVSVDAGFEGFESAFLPVSWWAISALAVLDRVDDAHAMADRLCDATPALQPEMLDVDLHEGRGNSPLVWSHAEAARALYLLRVGDLRQRWGPLGAGVWEAARMCRQLGRSLGKRGRTEPSQKSKNPA